jgi:predicted RNase H-like HicB family nuclease
LYKIPLEIEVFFVFVFDPYLWYDLFMKSNEKIHKKNFDANILVEKDIGGGFIVSIPGIIGAHADGMTLEEAVKNLNEVMLLLKEHYGEKKFLNIIKNENRFFGVIPYKMEYA